MTTHTHHFHGNKEHSTTYAAASFLMPGAAARVEAIRAKKRKLKHTTPPPATETRPAASTEEHHLEEVATSNEHETELQTQEQADSPVNAASIATNNTQGNNRPSDSPEAKTVSSPPDDSAMQQGPSGGNEHDNVGTTSMPGTDHVVQNATLEVDAQSKPPNVTVVLDANLVPDLPETKEMHATDEGAQTLQHNSDQTKDTRDTMTPETTKVTTQKSF